MRDLLRGPDGRRRAARGVRRRALRAHARASGCRPATGRVDELDSNEPRGHRRARAGRRRLGLRRRARQSREADAEAALERALAVAAAQPRAPAARRSRPSRPRAATARARPSATRSRCRSRTSSACWRRPTPRCATEPGVALTRRALPGAARRASSFASTEGALCEQRLTECGGGIAAVAVDGDESQIRSYPASHGGHVAQARLRALRWRSTWPAQAPRVARGGGRAAARAGLPARAHDADPRGRAARRCRSTSRSATPSSSTACSAARPPTRAPASCRPTRSARCGCGSAHVNVTADATTPGRPRHLPLGRRGRRGAAPCRSCARACCAGFLSSRETAAEIGLERSGGCMRADGFARQPIVRMTNVNLEPGDAGTLDDLIADTERRAADRDQPLVVDRRPPAALPVRGRGGLGDRGRPARPPAAQPELRGRDAGVLGELRRRLLAVRLAARLAARLRQGRAGAGHARVARRGAGALPRRRGRAWRERRSSSPSARRGGRPAERRRSRTSRASARCCCASPPTAPTQATAVDDLTVELAVLRDGHVGRADDQRRERRGAGAPARARAAAAAEAAAAGSRAGRLPRLPGAAPGPRATTATTPRRRALDPAPGGARAGGGVRRRAGGRRRGARRSGRRPRTSARWRPSAGRGRADRTTDAFMKVICIAPGGRSGYAARTARGGGASSTPEALAERAAAKARRPASRPSCRRASTRW